MTYLDPVHAAQRAEQEGRTPQIAPEEFWTDYEILPDGTRKPVDWVRWVKKGMQTPATVVEKVARISRPNKNGQLAPEWIVLEPYYKSWKAGEAAPVSGTPLAAWPGATPQLVKALIPVNIRSVEDLSEMEDSAIHRISIPGLREKKTQARAFLEAQKTTALVSAEVVQLREDKDALKRELAEMRELIEKFAIKKDEEEAPKRRGRPPKVKAEEAA